MRTPRRTPGTGAPAQPPSAARGRRAHAGSPADEQASRQRPADTDGGVDGVDGVDVGLGGTGRAATAPAYGEPVAPDRVPAPVRTGPRHPLRLGLGALRPRTVRAKIVSLLMVPVVSLLALWGFATVTTAQDMAELRHLQSVDTEVRQPVVRAVRALQDERRAVVRQAAAPGTARAAELKDRIRATDTAVARLRLDARHTVGDNGGLPREVATRVAAFVGRAEGLARLRTAAVEGHGDVDQLYTEYTATVTAGFGVGGALAGIEDAGSGADARVLLEFGRAAELLAREDTLLGAAQLTGSFDDERQRAFGGAVEARRTLTDSATADLPAAQRAAWRTLAAQPAYRQLSAAEDRVRGADPGRRAAQAVTSGEWDAAHAFVSEGLDAIEASAHETAAARHDPFGGGAFSAGGAAVLLGLAAVAASLVISVRIGRGLVVELISLRNTALEIARRKLPAAMSRLRVGAEIDVQAEAPPGPAPQDEIGQVGEALTTVHRAALSAAVERAELASGISGVFVNLARRSQVLVHRQLNLLDSMERRADDPNELGDLFRLDHLTTRMRRHAESLIILSGAAPGRAWRMPVPLTNVVRAAVSEIEDYARVEVRPLPETSVVGGAVADLTHLLAELVENAAQFSPPHTKVRISGEPVGIGYALEIEDRGLGMGKDSLAEANTRIAQSEALDLFDSDRLGLFVVSRLSSRHDIKVHLRTSPYGGTTAVVLIPTDLLQSALPPGRADTAGTAARTAGAEPSDQPDPATPATPAELTGPHDVLTTQAAAVRAGLGAPPRSASHPGRPVATATAPGDRPDPSRSAGHDRRQTPRAPSPLPPSGAAAAEQDGRAPGAPRPPRPPAPGTPNEPDRPPAGVTALRQRGPRGLPPAPPQGQAVAPAPSGASDAFGGTDLPRRVRQASLVPQLRVAPAPVPTPLTDRAAVHGTPGATTAERTPERTPEQVRDRMTAYHEGWRRGGGPQHGTGAAEPSVPSVPAGVRRPLGTGYGQHRATPAPRTDPAAPAPASVPRPLTPAPEGDDE
ncbi:nitrate- and nitrite sensing domain-containing protein [Streptomyces sp. NPDC090025]|uniref:sensor histidine kinase n=1 Tax=Streptomyces sp. NPDC090025 TaxID=3365922 RepID=UPI003835FC27